MDDQGWLHWSQQDRSWHPGIKLLLLILLAVATGATIWVAADGAKSGMSPELKTLSFWGMQPPAKRFIPLKSEQQASFPTASVSCLDSTPPCSSPPIPQPPSDTSSRIP